MRRERKLMILTGDRDGDDDRGCGQCGHYVPRMEL